MPLIIKLKCNNLIFNENIVLNALYVRLIHSHFIDKHPIWILEDEPLISEVVLSQMPGDNMDEKYKVLVCYPNLD
jgi:hypothetical protein